MADVSFKNDILPLFTQVDIDHMAGFGVELDNYDWIKVPLNAQNVYATVESKQMPPSRGGGAGPWSDDKVALLKAWIDGGCKP
jgi:hypothetical protein